MTKEHVRSRFWVSCVVLLLLSLMALEVGLSTRQQSPSWDEGDHIYSGYMNWKHGEYGLNPEHPPLVKLVATLPLLWLDLKIAPRQGRFFKTEAYYGGRELLFRNAPAYGGHYDADTLLFRVHLAVLLFGLTLGLLLFLCVQEMFGTSAGLIALALYVLDPTVLANAPFVATDTGASCGIFAAVYTFYRFVRKMSWPRAVVCGVAAGLALGAKHSAVLLLPIFLLLAAGELAGRWKEERVFRRREVLRLLAGMGAIAATAILVLWSIYSFRFSMYARDVTAPPLAQQMAPLSGALRWAVSLCMRFHLLPESYLYGLVDVQRVGLETTAYIFGKVYERGHWFYFPAILSLKWTAGTLGLLVLAVGAFIRGRVRRARELFFLVLPPLFFLVAAMSSPLNIGVRHVLPIFPFTFALCGAGAAWLVQQRRGWRYGVGALLLWHGVDSIRTYPNYLPFANVFWGGSANTNRFFSDSATDWAQQLKQTKQWTDSHHVTECWFAYFAEPFLLPGDYGIPCKPLPTLDSMNEENLYVPPLIHGPVLVSYGDLNGFEFGSKIRNPYQRLFERAHDDAIANGIAVFYGDFALPEAAALVYQVQSGRLLKQDPQAAVQVAQKAVALVPRGFDANLALGDAQAAAHNPQAARVAYAVAMERTAEMEPEAQVLWRDLLRKRMAGAESP